MLQLLEKVKKDARKHKIYNKVIAKHLNVSEGQVTHYFNDSNRIPFSKFITLVHSIYDDKKIETDLIFQFINLTTKKDSLREAAEWCSNNGYRTKLKNLISEHKHSDSFFQIYELILYRNHYQIKEQDYYLQVEQLKYREFENKESEALCKIATLYGYLDLQCYPMIDFLADQVLKEVSEIKSEYLRGTYTVRILEIKARSYQKKNLLREAKSTAELIINDYQEQCPLSANHMLMLLSEIHVFSNYKKSIEYITSALEQFESLNLEGYERRKLGLEGTYDFIKIYHGDFNNLYLSDSAERAHYYAKIGNKEEAFKILDQIEKKNGKLSAFQLYYKALAMNDKEMMQNAFNLFINSGDTFYSQITKET